MFTCLGRGVDIPARGRLVRSFCSNRCQRAAERRVRPAQWLETGVASISSKPDHYVRLCIAAEQDDRCAICALGARWNGMPLRLVLDHVDGDAGNNARSNLRLVCPNRDSQLDTYENRNNGRGRHFRRLRYANGQSY